MPNHDFAIAILNYNGLKHLENYLPKLIEYSKHDAAIYVIDNASTDNSVRFVSENYPDIHLIINKKKPWLCRRL